MESLENIGTQLSNLTVYDLKSYYSKAKGVLLNLTEYEQKVREATSNDPWGASVSWRVVTTYQNELIHPVYTDAGDC